MTLAPRSRDDIVVLPVFLVPGSTENLRADIVLRCDECGNVPVDPADGQLHLSLVRTPDRKGHSSETLFLGPVCRDREIARYMSALN